MGQTQALQTSNEIAAQTIAQMQSTRELLSENIIVQAASTMREIQERQDMINTMDQMIQPRIMVIAMSTWRINDEFNGHDDI